MVSVKFFTFGVTYVLKLIVMKKVKVLFLMLLVGVLFVPMAIAQESGATIDPNIPGYFVNLVGISALVTLLFGFLKKWLKLTGILAQVLSWVLAVAVCYVGWLFKWGIFETVTQWFIPAIYGIAVGLVSNGIFDIEFVKAILRLFKLESPKAPKAVPETKSKPK